MKILNEMIELVVEMARPYVKPKPVMLKIPLLRKEAVHVVDPPCKEN
jgi:hypothetical protein